MTEGQCTPYGTEPMAKGGRIPPLAMDHGMTRLCWDTQLSGNQRKTLKRAVNQIETQQKLEDETSSKIQRELEIRAEILDQVEMIQKAVQQTLQKCKEEDYDDDETNELLNSLITFTKLFANRERAAANAASERCKLARKIKKALHVEKEKARRRVSLSANISQRMNNLAFK